MKRHKSSGRRGLQPTTFSYILIGLQIVLMVAVLYYPGRRDGGAQILLANMMRVVGVGVVSLALWQLRSYSLSALPEPIKGAKLLTRGLYKRVRHPVYSGIMLWGLGTLIIRPSIARATLYGSLVALFIFKSAREERMLEAAFGSRYARYKLNTPRFIPRRKCT